MTGKIIDGKAIAQEMRSGLADRVAAFRKRHGMVPALAVILIGDNAASQIYVRMKEKAAAEVGIRSEKHEFASMREEELLDLIGRLNRDPKVHGILVQLPLPDNIDEEKAISAISPEKDVDGFHVENFGGLFKGFDRLSPCTPLGVMKMLEHEGVEIAGKEAVVIGRSNIVGKPMAMMLMHKNATVTVCHSRTRDLASHTRRADILVAAAGVPHMIKAGMVKPGAVVIDVGISRVDGKVVGDVDFDAVSKKASLITPVPGGVGPMTVATLMYNTVEAAERQMGGKS